MIEFLGSLSMILPAVSSAIGVAIGQGQAGRKSMEALNLQPNAYTDIVKITTIGSALSETASIFGTVISIILLLNTGQPANLYYTSVAKIGIAIALGISGGIIGYVSARPAQEACIAIARQPFFSSKILNLMLITQTLIMTPNIFCFLISLLILQQVNTVAHFAGGMQLLSSGISIGLGSIGPAIGLSMFAAQACQAIGTNRKVYGKVLSFSFVSCAIIETPAIFSLLVSLSILTTQVSDSTSFIKGIAFIAAALAMSLSTIAPGYSAGQTASHALGTININEESFSNASKLSLLALAMIDTFAIYGLLIAMTLIFVV